MILNSPFVTGSITVTDNVVASGSLTVLGTINGAVTGSVDSASYAAYAAVANSASYAAVSTSGSYAAVATSASFASTATSSSYAVNASTAISASQATNANTATSASYALVSTSGSYAVNTTSASYAAVATTSSYAANADLLDGKDSTEFAITGSNTFTGTQYASATNNAISFTSTASVYTDGGLRVTKDAYVSGTIYVNNLTVYGTQSINYITSSQLNIGTNIITVNTDTPAIRFGGLAVYDSGSTELTGSMLWDSEENHWVYSNPSGSSYDGGMMLSGPRNTSGLGNEQGTLSNVILKGQGGDHVTSSLITETGTATTFYTNALYVSSSNLVGVGTTSPNHLLSLSAAASNKTEIGLYNTFNDAANRNWALATNQVAFADFHIMQSNAKDGNPTSSGTTRLMINASGNVGIGTTSPGSKLQVEGGEIRATTTNAGIAIYYSASNGEIAAYNWAGSAYLNLNMVGLSHTFSTSGTERMRITSAGTVGIGTTPSSNWGSRSVLQLGGYGTSLSGYNGGGGATNLSHNAIANSFSYTYLISAGATTQYMDGSDIVWANAPSGTAGAAITFVERMRIASSGNVGIGTTSPGVKLHVVNSTLSPTGGYSVCDLVIEDNAESALGIVGTPYSSIYFGDAATMLAGGIVYNHNDDNLGFRTNGNSEKMRITSGGNVLIGATSFSGVSSSTTGLEVAGTNAQLLLNNTGYNWLTIYSATDSNIYNIFGTSGNYLIGTGLKNTTSFGEKMRITTAGNILIGYNQTTTSIIGRNFATNHASGNRGATLFYGIDDGSKGGMYVYNVAAAAGAYNSQYVTFETHEGGVSAGERMRITSMGKVLINTTASTGASGGDRILEFAGSSYSKGGDAGYFWQDRTGSISSIGWYATSSVIYLYSSSTGNIASINSSSGAYTALSDINKKKDLEISNYGLAEVMRLKPTLFRYKTDSNDSKKDLGFIAQEVKDIIPQAYIESEGFIGLNDRPLIATLVKAIQELKAEIDILKSK